MSLISSAFRPEYLSLTSNRSIENRGRNRGQNETINDFTVFSRLIQHTALNADYDKWTNQTDCQVTTWLNMLINLGIISRNIKT